MAGVTKSKPSEYRAKSATAKKAKAEARAKNGGKTLRVINGGRESKEKITSGIELEVITNPDFDPANETNCTYRKNGDGTYTRLGSPSTQETRDALKRGREKKNGVKTLEDKVKAKEDATHQKRVDAFLASDVAVINKSNGWYGSGKDKHDSLKDVMKDDAAIASAMLEAYGNDWTQIPYSILRARAKAMVKEHGIKERGAGQKLSDMIMNLPYMAKLTMEDVLATPIVMLRNSQAMNSMKKGDQAVLLMKGLGVSIGSMFSLQKYLNERGMKAIVVDHDTNTMRPAQVSKLIGEYVERIYSQTQQEVHLFGHSTGANNVRDALLYQESVRLYAGNAVLAEGTTNAPKSLGIVGNIFEGLGALNVRLDCGMYKQGRVNSIALNEALRYGNRATTVIGTSSMLKPEDGVDTRGGTNMYIHGGTHFRTAGTDKTINSVYHNLLAANTRPEERAANKFLKYKTEADRVYNDSRLVVRKAA